MIYMLLIIEFFKIGLFSFGGGFATVPFLYQLAVQYNWYTIKELTQMIGFASITPGPIGLNIATFAGIKTAGIFGALAATISEVLPSFILIILISNVLFKYRENHLIQSILEILRPISCALLFSVFIKLLLQHIDDLKSLYLLLFLIILSLKIKKNPLVYFVIAGIIGIVLKMF